MKFSENNTVKNSENQKFQRLKNLQVQNIITGQHGFIHNTVSRQQGSITWHAHTILWYD